jgi:pimeloyl-ACP methyl ester carboxylesterase
MALAFRSISAMTEPQSFRQTIDGVELQWSERGAGSNVLVLHGLSDSERSWWPVMADLGKRYRVFGLDLPGCGLSGRPDASYTLDWQARLVGAWLDRVGVTSCDVVGHSYGGGLAMWLLLHRAAAVRRLALVAPGGLGREVALELRLASLPFFTERLGQPWMGAVTRLLLSLNGHSLAAEDRARLLRFNTSPGTARAFARTVRDVIGWRGQTRHFLDRAADVRALPPIRLFWGEKDRIIPIHHGRELAASLENCSMTSFPNAGHFLHWERPHELASALLEYLGAPHVAPVKLHVARAGQAA